jgi:glycosyltransferase involved in cell wall biosynthesis
MTTPVSIVITCYNLGAYLREALDSALAQTYPNTEVVLVDDGSTDPATIAALDALAPHPRLRVIRTANQGVARARNHGFSQARGEYILPLDADDRILPEYVARAAAVLDSDPRVGFVGCHYRMFGDREGEYRPAQYALPDMLVENVVPIASVMRRRCWEEAGGYCAELNSIEDWDLWIGILERGYTGHLIPEIFFEYRIRPNSNISAIRDEQTMQRRMSLLYQRHLDLYTTHLFDVLLAKDRVFSQLHSYAMWQEQQAKNWERETRLLQSMASSSARTTVWWERQRVRWRRISAEHPTWSGRALEAGRRVLRIASRRVRRQH